MSKNQSVKGNLFFLLDSVYLELWNEKATELSALFDPNPRLAVLYKYIYQKCLLVGSNHCNALEYFTCGYSVFDYVALAWIRYEGTRVPWDHYVINVLGSEQNGCRVADNISKFIDWTYFTLKLGDIYIYELVNINFQGVITNKSTDVMILRIKRVCFIAFASNNILSWSVQVRGNTYDF